MFGGGGGSGAEQNGREHSSPASSPAGVPPADVGWRRWSRSGSVLALPGAVLLFALAWWGIDRDAWLDESFSVAATYQLRETYEATAYTMATYYAQLTLWTTPSVDLWWVRLLSVVHAVAAVLVVGNLAVRCFGRRVAVWSTVFLGASYMMVRYAHEARSFAFVVLLVSLGWLATDRLVEDPSRRRWIILHVVVGVLAPLTHGMAVFALAWQAAALLASRAGRRVWYATVPGWASAVIGTGLLYRIGGSELGSGAEESDLAFLARFLRSFHGGESTHLGVSAPWLLLFALSLYGTFLGLVRMRSAAPGQDRFRAALAPAWGMGGVVGILVLNEFRPGVHVRYAIAAVPGLALLWALGAEHVRLWLLARPSSSLRVLGRAPLVALVAMVVLLAGQARHHDTMSTSWSQVVSHVARESRPGDGVAAPGAHRPEFDVAWSRLPDPPERASVGSIQPLGSVHRFGNVPSPTEIQFQVVFTNRLWVIESREGRRREMYQQFIDSYVSPHGFTEVETWDFPRRRVHLFINPNAHLIDEWLAEAAG